MDIQEYIWIDDYLKGNLSGKELEALETRLHSDQAFREEVDLQRMANRIMVVQERVNIKKQLQEIHRQRQVGKSTSKWRFTGLGILLVVIVVMIYNIGFNTSSLTDHPMQNTEPLNTSKEKEAVTKEANDYEKVTDVNTSEEATIDQSSSQITEGETSEIGAEVISDENNSVLTNTLYENIQIIDNQNTKNEEEVAGIIKESPVVDPCLKANKVIPTYELEAPCFGHQSGTFSFVSKTINGMYFNEFSIDGGKNYYAAIQQVDLPLGSYELIARSDEGCLSKKKQVRVAYKDCNYVIQPDMNKYWEITIPTIAEFPITLEIRNARTGVLVYQNKIEYEQNYIWKGLDQSNAPLPMGNYVYLFTSKTKGLLTKGQIAIIK